MIVTRGLTSPTLSRERLFQAGSLSSFAGDGIRFAAIPLLAVQVGAGPGVVSLLFVAGTLPWLVMSPIAGLLADRWSRPLLLAGSDGARLAGTLLLLGALAISGHSISVAVLVVLSLGFGIMETLYDVTGAAIIPSLVADDRLESANGWYASGQAAGRQLGGPVLGAVLFAASRFAPFAVDALLYAAATLALLAFHGGVEHVPRPELPRQPRPDWLAHPMQGLRFLFGSPVLASLALVSGMANLSLLAVQATSVLFVVRTLHGSALEYSLTLAAPAVGALAGNLIARPVLRRVPGRWMLPVAIGGAAISFACAALAWTVWWVVGWYVVLGVCFMLWNMVAMSTRQRLVPDELRGRVESAYRCISWGALPIGAILGGVLAGAFGLRAPLVVAGGLSAVAAGVLATRRKPA